MLEEDNRILKVIEAYCTSAGSRNASNSGRPHLVLSLFPPPFLFFEALGCRVDAGFVVFSGFLVM